MAISARNKLRALVKSPSLSPLSFFPWKWLHCLNDRYFISNPTMSCMFSLLLLSGSPFFPCSPNTAASSSFRVSEHVKLPFSLLCTFNHDVLSNRALQTHTSYLPRKDQPKSCYICITFLCQLWCVQKGPCKCQDLCLDQHRAPAASITFKGSGVTPPLVFQPVVWHLLSGREAAWETFPL